MTKNEYIKTVQQLGIDQNDYIVIGSGILCALGIREVDDIDLIVSEPVFQQIESTGVWRRKTFDDGTYYLINDIYEVGLDWDSPDASPNLSDLKNDQIVLDNIPFTSLQRLEEKERQSKRLDRHYVDRRIFEEGREALVAPKATTITPTTSTPVGALCL